MRRIGKSRHGGHKISPLTVNGFENGFHQWIQHIFLVVVERKRNFFRKKFLFDALYRPVGGKPFVLEDLCLSMGTSVASVLTAETIFEIMKCIADVDMRGVKIRNFQVFQFWLRPR